VAGADVTASSSAGGAASVSPSRTIQEQVAAAAALAERVTRATVAPRPPQDANNTERPADAEPSASVPAINTDDLVALVMTQPQIKSVADLSGRDVAIEQQQSASSEAIRTAIAASGAAEVQLSAGRAKAIDRLISGEVPAAVLTLVSTEAAEWFPEIAGFRIYRVPLSPR
jgi:ABC-type phosphate/phosphonate transport system substrate-binding protein